MNSAANALAELRSLLAAATPGPWRWYWSQNRAFVESDTRTVVEVFDADPEVHGGIEHEADAALIVAAVNALPALIAVAEAAEEFAFCNDGPCFDHETRTWRTCVTVGQDPICDGCKLSAALTALHTNAAQDAGGGT